MESSRVNGFLAGYFEQHVGVAGSVKLAPASEVLAAQVLLNPRDHVRLNPRDAAIQVYGLLDRLDMTAECV